MRITTSHGGLAFAVGLDHAPAGVSSDAHRPDNIVYDITPQSGVSTAAVSSINAYSFVTAK